ncbi:MAG: hypothetical protein JW969_21305, partial [Spirochaetales bacterium]|nr:hypothetical protein [Spirochaetales bacterium]
MNRSVLSPVLLLMVIYLAPLAAEDQTIKNETSLNVSAVYYFGMIDGYNASGGFAPPSYDIITGLPVPTATPSDPGRNLGSGWGGAGLKVGLTHKIIIPFLTGDGMLFKDNNLEVKFTGELTPVTMFGLTEITLTPLALLKLSLGGGGGTGWSLVFNGLGLNIPGEAAVREEPFSGLVYKLWASATLQFDLG